VLEKWPPCRKQSIGDRKSPDHLQWSIGDYLRWSITDASSQR
jgi:hypothetical protein